MGVSRILQVFLCLALVAFLAGCGRTPTQKQEAQAVRYPEPRFPSYLKAPQSVEEVMPNARAMVRNKSGFQGAGLGVVESGEAVVLVASLGSEDMILEALRRALEERGVKVHILRDYELAGVSREDALALRKIRQNYTAEQGYMEAMGWVRGAFPDPEVPRKWLRERRPDLYEKLFPKDQELPEKLQAVQAKLREVGKALRTYLQKNPGVRGVFWGRGGGTGLRRALHPLEHKFLGVFTADNRWEVMSQVGFYPPDVWQMTEEKTMEPLAYVDRLEVTDPEGTHVSAEITPEMAERWVAGAYQRGHLYMFPNTATGRFGYSVVDYPVFQKKWLPREPLCLINGVVAGTNGHGGFFPRWEVHFKNGFISEVKGGGLYGDVLREFLTYPKLNETTFPFHKTPGFWYLYEIAFGTHPKYFRNPGYMERGTLTPERMRAGVIHWGLGIQMQHDASAPTESKTWLDFTAKNNMPRVHGFHTHSYFATYKLHLRNTDRWVTLLDRGHMTSLDHPEVRALASRYGDPNSILAEDWTPEIPGLNAPGEYAQYAGDPWKYSKAVVDQALAGTYAHLYPAGGPQPIDMERVFAAEKGQKAPVSVE